MLDVKKLIAKMLNNVSSRSGLIQIGNIAIQYGRASAKTTSGGSTAFPYRGYTSVTFSKAYASVPTVIANVEDWSAYWTATATAIATTSFVIELSGNANNSTKTVSWIAIGTVS